MHSPFFAFFNLFLDKCILCMYNCISVNSTYVIHIKNIVKKLFFELFDYLQVLKKWYNINMYAE